MDTINSLKSNAEGFGKKKYHLLPPVSAAAGICFQRKSGSFLLQLLVGNCWKFFFWCAETIHFWPQRPPILVRLPTRMYIGSMGFTPSSSHYQTTTLLVGDPYTAHTPLLSYWGSLNSVKITWKSKKTQQNKHNFWHSTLCFEIDKKLRLRDFGLFSQLHNSSNRPVQMPRPTILSEGLAKHNRHLRCAESQKPYGLVALRRKAGP